MRQIADAKARAPVHRQPRHVMPVEFDGARVGPDQPGNHVKKGRLAGAVGTQQADRLAAAHHHAHIFDDAAHPVGFFQVMDGEDAILAHGGGLGGRPRAHRRVIAAKAGSHGARAAHVGQRRQALGFRQALRPGDALFHRKSAEARRLGFRAAAEQTARPEHGRQSTNGENGQ